MRLKWLIAALAVCGQETTFRATVPVVQVPVTVTDGRGKLVDGLEAGDFRVTDNGRPVRFDFDTADAVDVPVGLIVAVQTNDLSAAALLKIQKIGAMVEPLITGEKGEAAVLAVDERAELVQEFTGDAGLITGAFRRLRARRARKAVVLDTVMTAAEMFRGRKRRERRVLLLIGESKDRGSETALEVALETLQRENIQVYAATFSATRTQFTTKGADLPKATGGGTDLIAGLGELVRLGKTDTAEALAVHTGGRKLGFATLRSLETIVTRVGEELHGQYLLTFPATGPEGFHAVQVELRTPGKRAVAARQGYWAVAAQ